MPTILPSLLTLSGFLLPALILLIKLKPRSAGAIVQTLLIALFCLFGGLLFTAATLALVGDIEAPLLTSALVVLGALGCLGLQQWWQARHYSAPRR